MRAARHLPRGEAERADRQQRQPDRPIRRRLVGPAERPRAGIARIEQIAGRQPHDKTRPQGAVAIGEPAARPVMRGRHHHVDSGLDRDAASRSEEHTSELQSLMRISYAVFCLKKKKQKSVRRTYRYTVQYSEPPNE